MTSIIIVIIIEEKKENQERGNTMGKALENIDENDLLRDLDIDGFRFVTYDANNTDRFDKYAIGYFFFHKDGSLLFQGEDFYCSPLYAIDSDDACRSLLGFLTLQSGDTDDEYFDDYTQEQLDFSDTYAENLSLYSMKDETDYPAIELVDWVE